MLEDLELPEAPSLDAANVPTPAVRQRRQRKRRRPSLGRNSNPGLELKKTALKIYFTKKENNSRYGMQDAADEANASRMDGSDKVKKSTLSSWKRDYFGDMDFIAMELDGKIQAIDAWKGPRPQGNLSRAQTPPPVPDP